MIRINKEIMLLIVLIVIIILVGVIAGIMFRDKDSLEKVDKIKDFYNEEKGVIEEREVKGILFSDISCKIVDGMTEVRYIITNNRDEEIVLSSYELVFTDELEEVIGTIYGDENAVVGSKESLNIESYTTIDLSNAVNMEVKFG